MLLFVSDFIKLSIGIFLVSVNFPSLFVAFMDLDWSIDGLHGSVAFLERLEWLDLVQAGVLILVVLSGNAFEDMAFVLDLI